MQSRVLRNTTAYVIAGMAPYAVGFFMLPVYTRYMTPEDYGVLAIMNTLSALLLCFSGLQMVTSIARYYFDYDLDGRRKFLSTCLFGTLLINIVIFLPLHLFGEPLTAVCFPTIDITYSPYVLLVMITFFLGSGANCCNAMLRVQEKGRTLLKIALTHTLLGVVFGLYFVVYKRMGAHGALLAGACNACLNFAYLLYANRSTIVFTFDRDHAPKALQFGFPIIPSSIGSILFIYSDKYILAYFVPLASIGLYDIADRIAMILRVAVMSFEQAYSPNFMRLAKEDKSKAKTSCQKVIVLWAVVTSIGYMALALFSEEILTLLTPHKYHAAAAFIPVLLGSYIFRGLYGFVATALLYEKKTKVIPLCTFAAGAINIVGNILCIPLWGVMAAAWTTLISYAIFFAVASAFSRKYFPLSLEPKILIKIFGTMTVAYLVLMQMTTGHASVDIGIKLVGLGAFSLLALKMANVRIPRLVALLRDAVSS